VVEKGADETKLGRWSWTRYREKNNQTLCNFGIQTKPPGGPFTVYTQQNTFFQTIGAPKFPRKAFVQDITKDIKKFLESGDHNIVLIDGNINTKRSDLKG
jgi:hypothetical protein